ncbi:hypothetical protein NHG33_08515 [Aerococcaceae bacterium NML130460]|nr:hypothetical protein [Aerococcaceae bacterium NML130460]
MNYEEQLEQMLQPIETELDKMNNITNECEKLKKQIKKVEAIFLNKQQQNFHRN